MIATLTFRKKNRRADIVTDGTNVRLYSDISCTRFDRLHEAISVLEAAGYSIQADCFIPADFKNYFVK